MPSTSTRKAPLQDRAVGVAGSGRRSLQQSRRGQPPVPGPAAASRRKR
jgi:hypothetical protein